MSFGGRMREWSRSTFFTVNNGISLAGVVITTGSGITLAWFLVLEMIRPVAVNPYLGILLFLVLPGIFAFGLALIPVGILLRRHKLKKEGHLPTLYPQVDLGSPQMRRLVILVGLATVVNVALLGTASFKGIDYMDSNKFCGLTCHTPMTPEYTAFLDSPHSRVGCAQCHIGPGADWFVKAKISGTRQLWTVTFGTFHRPIPSPVEALRPARETCEQCHWPQKFQSDKLFVHTKYASDETNTPATSVLLVKLGGRTHQGLQGIHGRHLDEGARISYVSSDPRRLEIPKVIYKDDQGQTVEYFGDGVKPEQVASLPVRKMDCIDCHNRPTHAFELPERAVDQAITTGRISRDLPFVKKLAVDLLRKTYPDQATASVQIPQAVLAYYQTTYPEVLKQHRDQVDAAGAAIKAVYLRNVFPDMKLTWGTHPNHLGHDDFPGCFRCHDGMHTSKDGKTITNDCGACHTLLAQEEKDPPILKSLGLK